ncbi:phage holin family protein [Candidatus Clostridium stratigraminis]|uniref:Phage holin family protein n=1 Tax=Candidatus Clostridium stratigraminis TaxID=3381661 RepID=A0ABW8T4T5_9CLOT
MDLIELITEQALILIPVLYIIGILLKNTPKLKDWLIPYILLVLGIVGSVSIIGLTVQAVIQGILVAGAAVFSHQLIKQTTDKKD